jgi:outer membrane protein OmpA-like peptidoglycan-associated protein
MTFLHKKRNLNALLAFCMLFVCEIQAQEIRAKSVSKYLIEKLDKHINSPEFDEITPVISLDGSTLFFTRVGSYDFNRTIWIDGNDVSESYNYRDYIYHLKDIYSEISGRLVHDPIRSDFNQDIWYAETQTSEYDHLVHPKSPLNNALPNSICSLTPNGNAYVVVNQFSRDGGMQNGFSIVYQSEDGTWSDPQPMQIEGYDVQSSAISLTMSQDAGVLVMSLPRSDSNGENDLYISFKTGENRWSYPKNMGTRVNTSGREVTPHLSPDGRELYFASDRYPSVGGLDLFYVSRLDEGWENWSAPRRFVEPINTPADETQPFFNMATGSLFFSSRREGTSDIYRVRIAPAIKHEVYVHGKIINGQTGKPIDARVLYGDAQTEYFEKYVETRDGKFVVKMEQGKPLKISPMRPGYISQEIQVNYDKNTFFGKPQEVTLVLDSLVEGSKIALDPIYFVKSKPFILKESYPALERLAGVLRENPEISISIEGHTDNLGKTDELQKLSEDRASEVKRFLMRARINAKRVEVVGYGGSKPISKSGDESSRRLNRRVEVKITKVGWQ